MAQKKESSKPVGSRPAVRREIMRVEGLSWSDQPDENWVRVYPAPENPTQEERAAAEVVRQFVNEVCVPDLKAAGLV